MRESPQNKLGTDRGEAGFTLVELLVVMLILALLAAIAIPAFFNQREKAQDADAKEYARIAQRAMETYATGNQGHYTGATLAELTDLEPTISNGTLAIAPSGPNSYEVTSTSDTGVAYSIERLDTGAMIFDCAPRGQGGCLAGGDGW